MDADDSFPSPPQKATLESETSPLIGSMEPESPLSTSMDSDADLAFPLAQTGRGRVERNKSFSSVDESSGEAEEKGMIRNSLRPADIGVILV
jgi:hypothetical protein